MTTEVALVEARDGAIFPRLDETVSRLYPTMSSEPEPIKFLSLRFCDGSHGSGRQGEPFPHDKPG